MYVCTYVHILYVYVHTYLGMYVRVRMYCTYLLCSFVCITYVCMYVRMYSCYMYIQNLMFVAACLCFTDDT